MDSKAVNFPGSESNKMDASVLGSRLSEKVDHLPIKKRRFMFKESSPPPPVNTGSSQGTESVAPCIDSSSKELPLKPEASRLPDTALKVADLHQSGDIDIKVEQENAVNASKKTGKDEDVSGTSLVDQSGSSNGLGGSANPPNMTSLEVLVKVKLEPNSVNLANLSAKETDLGILKAPNENVASYTMGSSSLGKAKVDNSRSHEPLESECSGMNQVTSETQKSADVDDRLNWDLNTVMDAWEEQPLVPDHGINAADAACSNMAKAKGINSYKVSNSDGRELGIGDKILPVVLKSLTPKIEKSELEECKLGCNGISKLLSPVIDSAPRVTVNKVFNNVSVPSTLTLNMPVCDTSANHVNVNRKGSNVLYRPMATGTSFSLYYSSTPRFDNCKNMSPTPTKEHHASSNVGTGNKASNAITTVQTTENEKLNLSLTSAFQENGIHKSGSTFIEDDKAEIKRAIINNLISMGKMNGNGIESSQIVVSSKTVGNNGNNVNRAITTLQTAENEKLKLSLVTGSSLANEVHQSGSTYDEDDKAHVKKAITSSGVTMDNMISKGTESSQNVVSSKVVGSGNNVKITTAQATENEKLNLSLTTTASIENRVHESEITFEEDDKAQVKKAITNKGITKENQPAAASIMHDVGCSEKSSVTVTSGEPLTQITGSIHQMSHESHTASPNDPVSNNKEAYEVPQDHGFGYENFPSDVQAGSEVDNAYEFSYEYNPQFEDGEYRESSIQTWERYEDEDRDLDQGTANRGDFGPRENGPLPESPSRIRSTDEISSVLMPEKLDGSDQVSGSELNETGNGITDVCMKDASQSDQWKMNVSGSELLPENHSSSSDTTKMRDLSSLKFSSRIGRYGLQNDDADTRVQGSRFYRREPLSRIGESSTRDAFLSRDRFRMPGCSSNNADDSASRPLRESGGLRSLRRGSGGATWNRSSTFTGPLFRCSVDNSINEVTVDQNDDVRPGPSYVNRQSFRSRLLANRDEDEFRARLGLRPSGETCHNRVVNVGRGRPLRYGSRPNGAGPRGRYFGPPSDEFDEPSLKFSHSFPNRRRCEIHPCAHHHSGSTSPPRSARSRSPINDSFKCRSRSPNLRSDTRIRRPRSPNHRAGFESDHAGGWVKYKQRSSLFDRRSPPPGRIDPPIGERLSLYDSSRKTKLNENYRSGHPGRFSDLRGGGRGGSRYLGSDGDVKDHGYRRGWFVRRYDMGSRPVKHVPYDEEDGYGGPVFDSREKEPLEFHGRGNPKPYVNGNDSRSRDLPRRARDERENW